LPPAAEAGSAGNPLLHVLFDDDGKDPPYFLQLSGVIQAVPVRVPGSLALFEAAALVQSAMTREPVTSRDSIRYRAP
jgi:hypothetical protein